MDLRATKKFTDDEAKDREKARVKERNRKKAGAIVKVEFPIEVRTAWEQTNQTRRQPLVCNTYS